MAKPSWGANNFLDCEGTSRKPHPLLAERMGAVIESEGPDYALGLHSDDLVQLTSLGSMTSM